MESFFHTLKTKLILRRILWNGERFRTREEARRSISEYVKVFYNRVRRHSALGYKIPAEHERLKNAA